MAELRLRVPGEPERIVPLRDRPLVLGRADDCDVQILDKKASKKHLKVERVQGLPSEGRGGLAWVATDLGSSNGTVFGDQRILRRALVSGDVLRVGDVEIELRDAEGAPSGPASRPAGPAVVLSGALVEQPTVPAVNTAAVMAGVSGAGAKAAVVVPAAPADAGDEGERESSASSADAVRANLAGRRALGRGAAVLGAGIAVIVLVEVVLGGLVNQRGQKRDEADAFNRLVESREEPWEKWKSEYERFATQYPASRHRDDLDGIAARRRAEDERVRSAEEELLALNRNVVGRSESEIVGRLMELRNRVGEGSPLATSITIAIEAAQRRLAQRAARDFAAAETDADRAIARGEVSAAMRRLAAFEASHALLSAEDAERLAKKRAALVASARTLADAAIAQAGQLKDADARRAVLVAALRGLADTAEGERLRQAVSGVSGGSLATAPRPGATPAPGAPSSPGTPSAPTARPTPAPDAAALAAIQAKAAAAEDLARERKWAAAAEAYAVLAKDAGAPAPRREEWGERADDLARVGHLVDDLGAAAAAGAAGGGASAPRVKLAAGTADVVSADATNVKLRRGQNETAQAWAALTPEDTLALLSFGKETPDRRLALALLAADLGDRAAAIRQLAVLVETPSHKDAAFRVIAHRLEGRSSVPDGGYFAFEGELIGKAEYDKRSESKRLTSLIEEAGKIVEAVAKDPGFKTLERLRSRRDELDRRRAYALVAIFNETHWPYPHNDEKTVPRRVYDVVTEEVTRRWKSVGEVWDEPLKVNAPKGEALEKAVTRHRDLLRELESRGRDVTSLRKAMEPYGLYVGAGPLTIRTFFRTPEEKELLEYNRWVTDVYNPSMTTVASDEERKQVQITNEYRTMMGWQFMVQPGPASLFAIEPKNVVEVLDSAHETNRIPLRALRIDNRLILSARGHSIDMAKRGFFDHFAPPNPPLQPNRTSPFDRMQAAGYMGMGMSENIVAGGDPMGAHLAWLHSSGHHRNIISDWADMGAGWSGGPWTQNFGVGGGAATAIPGREPIDSPTTPPDDSAMGEGGGGDAGK